MFDGAPDADISIDVESGEFKEELRQLRIKGGTGEGEASSD